MTDQRSARLCLLLLFVAAALSAACGTARAPGTDSAPATGQPAVADPLPSWNDTASRRAIVDFVTRVTKTGGPDFVPPSVRIATFDNDGTLWAEQPIYTQFVFALDRVKTLAARHPDWKQKQP